MLNSLANDDRQWGGNVNGGGWTLSNVNISGSNFNAPLSVPSGSLPSTVNSKLLAQKISALSVNDDTVQTAIWRTVAGSQWDSAVWRIARIVDTTEVSALDIGPYTMAMRIGGATKLMLSNTGLGVGTANPICALNVVPAANPDNSYTTPQLTIAETGNSGDNFRLGIGYYLDSQFKGAIQATHISAAQGILLLQPRGGSVGIGISIPTNILDVYGTTYGPPATSGGARDGTLRLAAYGHGEILDVGVGGGHVWLQARSSNNYASNYALLLNPNGGFVGIGTTAPNYPLDIVGGAVPMRIRNNDPASNNCQIRYMGRNANADLWAVGTDIAASNGSQDLHFWNAPRGGAAITIQATTNRVGISNTAPAYILDVVGQVNATGGFLLNGAPHLAVLAKGPDDLPPDGGLNLWLDEAAGRIAVRYRNASGALKTGYISIE